MNVPMPPVKVMLPIVARDHRVHLPFMMGVLQSVARLPDGIRILQAIGGGLAISRNWCAFNFMRSDADYLFFIDSDVGFKGEHFQRILMQCILRNLPIVGGMYAKRQNSCEWVMNCFDPGDVPDPESGLLKVRHLGTGFLCIHRNVFAAIEARFPELKFGYHVAGKAEMLCDFFPIGARSGSYEPEDWAFCRMAQECGFDVYVDTGVQLLHFGEAAFPHALSWTDAEIDNLIFARGKVRRASAA